MALPQPGLQALGRERHGIGVGDAHDVETQRLRARHERALERLAGQKSRFS